MTAERKTVLVTGASGFIGGHAARSLAGDGRTVVAPARRESAGERPGLVTVRGSFTDRRLLREIFERHRPQEVLHLAALRGGGRGRWEDYRRVNVEGTETLLEESAAHGVESFVFCSSVGVHGTIPPELPAGPATAYHGDSDYHRSKILGEEAVSRFIDQGLNAFIVRPTITYGAGDNGFPATLVSLVRRRRFPLPRHEVLVHLLDVTALCRLFALLLAGGCPGGRIIIAADRRPVRLSDLVDEIHRRYHGRAYPRFPFLPRSAARALRTFAGIVGSARWRTRIRLISEDWHYRTGCAGDGPDYAPPDTLAAFPESMCR